MPGWLQYLIAFGVLLILAPVVAMVAKVQGRRIKGGLLMAGVLLGLGEVVDPPSKHRIEAQGGKQKRAPDSDEPVEP